MDEDWDESDYKCISFKRVKARKPYVCHYCGNAIPTGATYVRHVYTQEGEFHSAAEHSNYHECGFDKGDESVDVMDKETGEMLPY
jgi:hypothetical protein